jgi:hypothetical protein
MFAFRYISEGHDIKTINELSQNIEQEANRKGLPDFLDEFLELSDSEGLVIM